MRAGWFNIRDDGLHRGELLQQAAEATKGQRFAVLRDTTHMLGYGECWAIAILIFYACNDEVA